VNYPYPMVRGGGAFLMCIGSGIAIGAVWAADAPMNIPVFATGAVLGFVALVLGRRIFPLGRPATRHVVAMSLAVTLELLLFWIVFSRLPADTSPVARWLWGFLIVGVHFFPMGLALGRRAVLLGAACVAVAILGLLVRPIPFGLLAVVDGLLKVGFGASLAMTGLSRPALNNGVTT
jgi:hypothetical protein